jgi:hypothetical protein
VIWRHRLDPYHRLKQRRPPVDRIITALPSLRFSGAVNEGTGAGHVATNVAPLRSPSRCPSISARSLSRLKARLLLSLLLRARYELDASILFKRLNKLGRSVDLPCRKRLCTFWQAPDDRNTGGHRVRPSASAFFRRTGTKPLTICGRVMRAEDALALMAATTVPRMSRTGTAMERSPSSSS